MTDKNITVSEEKFAQLIVKQHEERMRQMARNPYNDRWLSGFLVGVVLVCFLVLSTFIIVKSYHEIRRGQEQIDKVLTQ